MIAEHHTVEYARTADGSMPARIFLHALRDGVWENPENPDESKDSQISDYDWFLDAFKHFIDYGEPQHRTDVEYLDGGVWEMKHDNKRVTFYDTDGVGGDTPKVKITDRSKSPYPDSKCWHIPDFDDVLRLGYCFPKTGEKAGEYNVNEAKRVRQEDLQNDRS